MSYPFVAYSRHVLIFEPGTAGHHLTWLRYVVEEFLAHGHKLTVAVDLRPTVRGLVCQELVAFKGVVDLVSAFDERGGWRGGGKISSLVDCLHESGADEVFMNNFDELAAGFLRRSAFGLGLPKILRGRLNAIYFRPRFLADGCFTPKKVINSFGFARLSRERWIKKIFLLDEYLLEKSLVKYPDQDFRFLPDPWSGDFSGSSSQARHELDVPNDRFIFLQYGIGTRRKGLHLVVQALLGKKTPFPGFLLCAGKITGDTEILRGLKILEEQGMARVIDRYVSTSEEELCFRASNAVLLPYVNHFGSSGVLARAAAAGKMVIVSDEQLLAKRVKGNGLGILFTSGNVLALDNAMKTVVDMPDSSRFVFEEAARRYAASCSLAAFRQAIFAEPQNR